jgi:hypothetical protein
MRRKRKTAAERRQEAYEAERRAWDLFLPRLRAVSSLKEALMLNVEPVSHGSPGRKFYSNFGFFMQYFAAPDGANLTELNEYLRLIKVFDAEGALKSGKRDEIEKAFELAMTLRPRW